MELVWILTEIKLVIGHLSKGGVTMARIVNALSVEIYKSKFGDSSNGGISSRFDEIIVECPDGYLKVDLDNPPPNFCVVVKRILWGEEHYYVRPYAEPNGVGWMYGGCIVDTSDHRWCKLTEVNHPLHLHDRTESQELYDMLSR